MYSLSYRYRFYKRLNARVAADGGHFEHYDVNWVVDWSRLIWHLYNNFIKVAAN